MPKSARFKIERLKGDKCKWSYAETAEPKYRKAMQATVAHARLVMPGLKISVSSDGCTVRFSGISPTKTVASMIVGEFIGWSELGQMTIWDIMGSGMIKAAQAVADERGIDLPEFQKALKRRALPRQRKKDCLQHHRRGWH